MSEPKPFASLSSGLLARKGAARPAMRPQGFGQMGASIDDLGWNDMGYAPPVPAAETPRESERPQHVPSSISALTPSPRHAAAGGVGEEGKAHEAPPEPAVLEQQRAIAASFPEEAEAEAEAEAEEAIAELEQPIEDEEPETAILPVEAEPAPVIVPMTAQMPMAVRERQLPGAKGKAAFTLRLDAERHLKLRLACAVTHRSAQQIVSGALDQYLKSLPELDEMAGKMPAKTSRRR
jgi:hypothetical protein